jgi:hypothetical protein
MDFCSILYLIRKKEKSELLVEKEKVNKHLHLDFLLQKDHLDLAERHLYKIHNLAYIDWAYKFALNSDFITILYYFYA